MNDYTLEALNRRSKLTGVNMPEYDRMNPAAMGMGSTGYGGSMNQQFDTKKPMKQQKQEYPDLMKMSASGVMPEPREAAVRMRRLGGL